MFVGPGRAGVRSRTEFGALSAMGHGGLLDPPLAPTAERQAVLPRSGAALHRPQVVPGLDRCRELLLVAEGEDTGPYVLSTCVPAGPYLRLCVHAERARVDRRGPKQGDQLLPVCFTC